MTKLLNIFTCRDTQNDEDSSHYQDVCLEQDREKCQKDNPWVNLAHEYGCRLTVMEEVEGQ